ncbi:MAG: YihY/virulence factor BrkB family protein, partial [Sphingopyxis sp.]|nr:YihY/virulence factor BrkB family protein [Sphingopyxis sp.]
WRARVRTLPGFCRGALKPLGRAALGTFNDGFIHAGNLAYLSLITLFPFFIAATFIAGALGQGDAGRAAVEAVLATMPAGVTDVIREPVYNVLDARSGGSLVWIGALVGLWTVAGLIETVRDILRRAYRTEFARSFWQYRLASIGMIIGAVLLMMISFTAEVAFVGLGQFIDRLAPRLDDYVGDFGLSRYAPLLGLFLAIYILFLALTPAKFRGRRYAKWPGALLTALWWVITLWALPLALAYFFSYDLTYGSLAGVMITLLFFYVVGLGLVMGAEYNAALAKQADACEVEEDVR